MIAPVRLSNIMSGVPVEFEFIYVRFFVDFPFCIRAFYNQFSMKFIAASASCW